MHKTAPNETNLMHEIPNMIYEENVIISPISILNVEFFEEEAFLYVLYVPRDITILDTLIKGC